MKNALQEQLLKAGLADEKKLKNVKKEKHVQRKQAGKKKAVVNEATLLAKEKHKEQVARDQELNRQRKAAADEKAVVAQVRQLITVNRVAHEGEIAFNFADGTLVKRLHVSQKIHNELTRGKLAIARDGDGYALIPVPVANKIQERSPAEVVLINDNQDTQNNADEDDPYADYKIPDDLMW
ncbi:MULTISPECIES: DUF2058 domain-containing protein [Gammaproteobacteria]|uniref:DUF2058 domain-containing protein n=1 Tax=Gammaproteobacteria TaxID=1236 RepID=UPI000DD0B8F1|nr:MULTISPECIES: DUF2058 domain-containing protein [Gammaproteobacteria]RTE86263.1 DUF2058 domain-containing protein [Aliidiomarina sp. B3213]TCZ91614.1 DUF2058 domain-containing protein [Lysobacter sp. N42]